MVNSSAIQEKCYTHLSLAEREEIAIALEQGRSRRSIAASLGRNPSSISREIRRNAPPLNTVKYRENRSHERAKDRARRSHAKERLANPLAKIYVEYHLIHDRWTPESIAGRLPLAVPGLKTNHESIYLWIYTERQDLIPYLVRSHKKRHKRPSRKKSGGGGQDTSPGRHNRTPASYRSEDQAGHWEVDTIVSRQSAARVAVLVERKTRFFLAIRMKDKTASAPHEAVTGALSGLPSKLRRTFTYDNGLEI